MKGYLMIKGMKITDTGSELVEIGEYTDYYKLIGCSCFDVARVMWEGKEISLFVDDEGLFKDDLRGRMVVGYPQPLFGPIVAVGGVDTKGETLSLPDEFLIDGYIDKFYEQYATDCLGGD